MLPHAVETLVKVAEQSPEQPPDYVMAQYHVFSYPDQSDARFGYEHAPGRYWAPNETLAAGSKQSPEGRALH